MVGIDYTDDHFALPLYWLVIARVDCGRGAGDRCAAGCTAVVVGGSCLVLHAIVPAVAGALYVKPNEISLERPYIQTHIEATRAAYGLSERACARSKCIPTRTRRSIRRSTGHCSITCVCGTGDRSTTP